MAPKKPLLEQMKDNPQNDWLIADVARVCRENGWTCQKPSNGSHYKASHPVAGLTLTIPAKRPIKPVYIKALVDFIERLRKLNPNELSDQDTPSA